MAVATTPTQWTKYVGPCENCGTDLHFIGGAVLDEQNGAYCAISPLRGAEFHVIRVSLVTRAITAAWHAGEAER